MLGKNARIINQYYALSLMFSAGGMSIISAIYVTYLLKHGLNLFEVNWLWCGRGFASVRTFVNIGHPSKIKKKGGN